MTDATKSQRTVVHLLQERLAADPNHAWIVMEHRTYTVSEMDGRSEALANGLARFGVEDASPVLIMLPNGIEFIDCWLPLAKLRAIQVPVNTSYFGAMLEHMLRDSGSVHIVV